MRSEIIKFSLLKTSANALSLSIKSLKIGADLIPLLKKQIIISSQILEGSIHNYIPLRSDILDLTNIVLDGADGIMLCNETALSSRPAYTLSVAKKIIFEAEKYKKLHSIWFAKAMLFCYTLPIIIH